MTTAARAWFRAITAPLRLRVTRDLESLPVVPGRLGRIEPHCDGQDCHGCPEPGSLLAVWTNHSHVFGKIGSIPSVRPWQTGDIEMRALFPPEGLEQVAAVIHARRRRPPGSAAHLQKPHRPPVQGDFPGPGTPLAPRDVG
jgi:hypothetical protein